MRRVSTGRGPSGVVMRVPGTKQATASSTSSNWKDSTSLTVSVPSGPTMVKVEPETWLML